MNLWLINFDDVNVKPPESMWAWMQTKTSITEKARDSCQVVRLKLLKEDWESTVFIREINLFCDEKIAWYARTWIPEKTYQRRSAQFKALHGRPLADILYNDPDITREDFVYAYLDPSTLEYQWAMKHYPHKKDENTILPTHLWARKSVFLIDGEPLYLMEIFFNVP